MNYRNITPISTGASPALIERKLGTQFLLDEKQKTENKIERSLTNQINITLDEELEILIERIEFW